MGAVAPGLRTVLVHSVHREGALGTASGGIAVERHLAVEDGGAGAPASTA